MKRRLFVLGLLALAAVPAWSADLWNQETAFDSAGGGGAVDQEFGDLPTYSSYAVDDVVVNGGWNVTSIDSLILVSETTDVSSITQARLNVFTNSGSLPVDGDDPTAGTLVNVSVTADSNFTNVFHVTASGLNLNWAAGEYWVGLTPVADYGANGFQTYLGFTDPAQNPAGANHTGALRNPGGAFGFTNPTGWNSYLDAGQTANSYGAIDIQGSPVPEPASMAVLGMGVLALIRRRRSKRA